MSSRNASNRVIAAAVRPLLEMMERRSYFTANIAPVANPGGPYSVAEGQSINISGTGSTDSDGTVASYAWDTSYVVSKGFRSRITGSTWTFSADDSGTRTIALKVTDNSGDVSIATTTINVSDVAPTITLTAPATADEATPVNISWTHTDPGVSDTVTGWSVDWGDSSTPTAYAGTATAGTHTYDENGSYTMTLTATQADATTSVTHAIVVNNVVPVVVASSPHPTIDEGEMAQVSFASPNRGGTLDSWTVNWGDGTTELLSASRSNAAHFYNDSGLYTATITAQEPDGGNGSATVALTVRNVAADISITGTPATGTEGTAITFGSTKNDPGVNDTHVYGWTVYRNGTQFTLPGGTTLNGTGFTFTPTDNGSYVARLTVVDDEGASATVNSTAIVVGNVAPTATIAGTPGGSINEGTAVNLTVTPADAGAEDTFSYAWTVAKGGAAYTLPNGTVTNAAAFAFTPSDNGSYVATVVVTDDDNGTVSVSTAAITVTNVAPTAAITGTPATSPEGSDVTVASTVADAGAADTFAYAWSVTKGGVTYNLGATPVDGSTFAFRPNDNGSYVVRLTVTDDDGGTVNATSSAITVTNVAPTAVVTGDDTGDEGSALNYSVAPSDAGSLDTFTYAWSVTKGGVAYTLPGGTTTNAQAFGFTPVDNGAYVVSVVVTDKDGAAVTATQNVTVVNVKPVAVITGAPATGPEGTAIALDSLVTDVGTLDTFTYAWSVTNGGAAYDLTAVTTNTHDFTFTPNDNGSYVVTLAVTDNGGAVRTVSTSAIVVGNVAPTGTVAGAPAGTIGEGADIDLLASGADVGSADTLGYAWTITKNGSAWTPVAGTVLNNRHLVFVPTDNGTYVATVAITDDDGGTVSVPSQAVVVLNSDPVAAITGAPATGPEGTAVSVGSTVQDDGTADTFTYAWSVARNGVAVNLGSTVTTTPSLAFTPRDNGAYVVTLAVTDDDGGVSTTTSSITVTNVAPAPVISGLAGVNEDAAITLTVAANDVGVDDTHTYAWSVTKGGVAYNTGAAVTNGSAFTFTPNVHGAYVVSCLVTDNNGGATTATKTVTVANLAPTAAVTGLPSGPRGEGSPISLTGVATDASGETGLTYAWTVTRGGVAFPLPGGTVTNATAFTFTPTDNGLYRATFTVTDSGGLTASATTTNMVVTNALPDASITGTPVGSVAEGSSVVLHVDAADPGSEDTLAYAWSVTKGGVAFALPGGTVTNTADFTFVPTDNGTYVATALVTDDDGGPVTISTSAITVTNVNPVASIGGTPGTAVAEGSAIDLFAGVSDAGTADTFTYAWSVTKNGSAYTLPAGVSTTAATFGFVPTDNGTYVTTLTVTDDDAGANTVVGSAVTVNNVAPTAAITGAPATSPEGTAIGVAVNAADAGSADTLTYAWSVTKDGNAYALPNGTATTGTSFAFTPTDNGSYVVSVAVTDDDAGTVTASSSAITVTNVAPTAVVSGDATGLEGSVLNYTVAPSDVGSADTFTYAWSVTKDGNAFALPNGTVTNGTSFAFTPTDNGSYVVSAAVTDDDTGTVTATKSVTVANVLPTATITGTPATGVEGTAITLGSTKADAGSADTHTYAWTVLKDGEAFALPQGTVANAAGFTFTPTDNGSYVAHLVVTDDDAGQVAVDSTAMIVANVAPTATVTGAPVTAIDEGQVVSLLAHPADAGSADTFGYAWSVTKDGEAFALPEGTATDAAAFAFTATDNGSYVATVVVTDDDAATVSVSTTAVTVNNVAPTGTISGPTTGTEGAAFTVTADVTDAGALDTIGYAWSVTKDGDDLALPLGTISNGSSFDLVPADEGVYAFTCVATDKDGTSATLTHSVTVANVAPTVDLADVPDTGVEGTAITVGSTVSDPGVNDVLTYGWTVYRNNQHVVLPEGTTIDGDGLTFTPSDNGSYVVRLTVLDGDTGSTTVNSTAIVVAGVAPVVAITGDTDGTEGEAVALGSTATDAGPDDTTAGLTYAWTIKKGSVTVATGAESELSFTPAVHGAYSVKLVVTDKDGLATTTTSSIDVANTAPADLAIEGELESVSEGDVVALSAAADDASGDTITYGWQVTQGEDVFASGTGADFTFNPTERGDYRIEVIATDTAGESVSTHENVTVANVAPTATVTPPTGPVLVGAVTSFGLSIGDVPAAQGLGVTWDFGDGTTASADYTGSQTGLVRKHAYAARGNYTVTATVTDGEDSTVVTKTVLVSEASIQADPLDATKTALFVFGSAANDNIAVTQLRNGKYAVTMNGATVGNAYAPTGRVVVYGNAGANNISVDGALPALVFAGGSTASNVTTGNAADIVVGTSGADRLTTGGGNDIVIGAAGADILHGGDGEDLMVAAGTTWMNDTGTLATVKAKWLAAGDVTVRRTNVIAAGVFKSTKYIADAGSNQVFGEAKNDWMTVNKATDRLKDVAKGDLTN